MSNFQKEDAVGKWLSILGSLGVDIRGDGKHETCPLCKREGAKGFRFTDIKGNGEWICTCGNGNGWDLVMEYFSLGDDFKSAVEMVGKSEDMSGGFKKLQPKEKKLMTPEGMRKMFGESSRISKGDVADVYLTNRGIKSRPDNNVWHSRECWHSESKENHNAMLCIWHMPDGTAVAFHRTYLTPEGDKLPNVESNKKMSPATVKNIMGGCVRLFELGESKILGIGEGPETCLAASQDFGIPFWSTTGAEFMAGWVPPKIVLDQVEHLVLVGDNDRSFTGQKVTYTLARKLAITHKKEVSVFFPDKTGCDWLDVLNGECGCRLREQQPGPGEPHP